MTVWSRHSAERLGFRKARRRTRYVIGTAIIATLSYLTVLLSCAYPDGNYLGSSVVQPLAIVGSEIPGRDTDEDLCKLVHEQMLTLQACSTGPILVAKAWHMDALIGEEALPQTAILNAFRPPGTSFVPAKELSFHLHSVLRI